MFASCKLQVKFKCISFSPSLSNLMESQTVSEFPMVRSLNLQEIDALSNVKEFVFQFLHEMKVCIHLGKACLAVFIVIMEAE